MQLVFVIYNDRVVLEIKVFLIIQVIETKCQYLIVYQN